MFRRILIAIRSAEERRSLAATAAGLASPGESTVLVVHVRKYGADPDGILEAEALVEMTVQEAKRLGVSAEGEAVSVDPDREIGRAVADAARGWHADVVVVGSRRLSDLQAALHGSVSHSVIHFAGCPVVVAPLGATAPVAIRSILLAIDGSKAAQAAERVVTTLARERRAKVSVLHVAQPLVVSGPFLGGWYAPPPEVDEVRIAAVGRLREAGIDAVQVDASGSGTVAAVIAGAADELDADLVVLGSRGLGGVAGLIRGSVSHEVMHETERAVLIARGESD